MHENSANELQLITLGSFSNLYETCFHKNIFILEMKLGWLDRNLMCRSSFRTETRVSTSCHRKWSYYTMNKSNPPVSFQLFNSLALVYWTRHSMVQVFFFSFFFLPIVEATRGLKSKVNTLALGRKWNYAGRACVRACARFFCQFRVMARLSTARGEEEAHARSRKDRYVVCWLIDRR